MHVAEQEFMKLGSNGRDYIECIFMDGLVVGNPHQEVFIIHAQLTKKIAELFSSRTSTLTCF